MFFGLIWNKKEKTSAKHPDKVIQEEEKKGGVDIELLRLKYEKLQYIEEKERDRDKTVETKASMFIGSTSIMGAIIIGCANLVSDSTNAISYVNTCILLFLCILIFCLGRSITYSVLTLRKRRFWYLGIDDLENTGNKEEYYKKLIDSTIRIIKHNQGVINSKVDSMQIAQESFVDFWIWSGIFFTNLVMFHLFHAYGMEWSSDMLIRVVMTMLLSGVVYLVVKALVEKLKTTDEDEHVPAVDKEIRSVCMMAVSEPTTNTSDEVKTE